MRSTAPRSFPGSATWGTPAPSTPWRSAAPPFARVGKRGLRSLASAVKPVEHAEGHQIVEEGGSPLGFHLITAGEAVVEVGGDERRRLGAGDYFWLISLIDGKPRSATVRATTALRTVFLSPSVFKQALDSEPSIARDLLPLLCEFLREAEHRSS